MKIYDNKIKSKQLLRSSLFFAYFLGAVFTMAGCGQEAELLSELRREEPSAEEGFGDTQSQGQAAGHMTGIEQEADGREAESLSEPSGADVSLKEETEKSICVHVCGAVVSPGVYELPAGSRFYEAVEKAGGFAEEAARDYLNMAAYLEDGSRLEIPSLSEAPKDMPEKEDAKAAYRYYTVSESVASGNKKAESDLGGLININTADIAGLCALPGVGEGRAKAIIEYRERQGGFQKKEDIMQVSGIGEKM